MAVPPLAAQGSLSCSICLDLLNDPVTIPCGHSYCLSCINSCWDQDDQMGVYRCPQCRQTFTPRPVLNRNTMLTELAEGLRKMRLQAAPPDDSYAGPGDVECDVCTATKYKAVKSCLACLMSFCTTHLQSHYEVPAYRKHKLVDASVKLQEKICPQHDKLLEIYCRTDQKGICIMCVMDGHKGHETVSAPTERKDKQKQLLETQREFRDRIQQREKELQDLFRSAECLRRSAQRAVENSERIFTELILSIERKRAEVEQQIRAQEEAELSLSENLQKKLKQEIADLRRRHTELEQLSHTDDHIYFLQSLHSLSVPPGSEYTSSTQIPISPHFSTDELSKAVSELKKQVDSFDSLLLAKISGGFDALSPQPKTREDFLKYSCQLTFDPNTAHKRLQLSQGNRKVTLDRPLQDYPDHQERFDEVLQVLCRESLSGRCYYEVEFSILNQSWIAFLGNQCTIAVCYKDIIRKGDGNECKFGFNDQSWSFGSNFNYNHNNTATEIPAVFFCSKIGVYVDHSAGILSFYSISDTMILLHTVQTTFTKPLYAGFQINGNDNYIKICDLN